MDKTADSTLAEAREEIRRLKASRDSCVDLLRRSMESFLAVERLLKDGRRTSTEIRFVVESAVAALSLVLQWTPDGKSVDLTSAADVYTFDAHGQPVCPKCGTATNRVYALLPKLTCWSCGSSMVRPEVLTDVEARCTPKRHDLAPGSTEPWLDGEGRR